MSEENVELARRHIAVSEKSRRRRHLDEALILRFPRLFSFVRRRVLQRPPRSRLRQAMLLRAARLATDADKRGDQEAVFLFWDPDCVSIPPPELAAVGEGGTTGIEERIRTDQRWREDWGEFTYQPEELIDLGERVLVVGRVVGSGAGSGVAVGTDWGLLLTLSARGIAREEIFFNHREALEAAGLSE
jgi:hypothetical protein